MIDVQRRDKSYSRFNLDYDNLNSKLNVVKSRVIKTTGMRRASSALSLIDTRTFAEVLDQEVEKVVLFYIQEQGSIAKKVWQLRERQLLQLQRSDVAMNVIDDLFDSFRELGGEILSLLDYLDDNVIKLRKIISKHDTLFDQKMSSYYFSDNKLGKSSRNQQLLPLYHQEGIQAIMSTIRRGFEDLYEAKDALSNPLGSLPGFSSSSSSSSSFLQYSSNKPLPRVSFGARQLSYGNLQDSLSDKFMGSGKMSGISGSGKQDPTSAGNKSTGNLQLLLSRSKTASRDSSLSQQTRPRPALSVSDMEPILRKITEAASHLMETQQQSISEYLAATSLLALEVSVDDILLHRVDSSDLLTDGKMKVQAPPPPRLYGLYVNLLITFLYLANQYVVAPTSGEYARLLGMSSTLSGLIIGLTPAAALLSSLVYSMWSNHSFKDPILCCILCAFTGNVFYGMALQWDASWMILVGRLLTGFGGPRVISRRYIVDHVPPAHRQVASSQFVTAGALGLAFGPLLSSLVTRSAVHFEWGIDFQAVTAPGWIMASLWLLALLATLLVFEEPDQKRMRCNKDKIPQSSNNYSSIARKNNDLAVPGYYQYSSNQWPSSTEEGGNGRSPGNSNNSSIVTSNQGGFDYSTNVMFDDKVNRVLKSAMKKTAAASSQKQPPPPVRRPTGLDLYQISEGLDERLSNNSSMVSLGNNNSNNNSSDGKAMMPPQQQQHASKSSFNSSTASLLATRSGSSADALSSSANSSSQQACMHSAIDEKTPLLDSQASVPSTVGWATASAVDSSSMYQQGYSDSSSSDIAVIIEVEDDSSCFQYFSYEVVAILIVYIVNKLGQELTVSSIPLITCSLLGWSQELSGYYMCFMGALVLPMNILVNRYVHDVDERDMVLRLTYMCICTSLLMCHSEWLGDSYAIGQYVLGSIGLFVCLNSLEGIIMAVLAKIVSPDLARGTFNSALLATEAGTLGRVVGDLFLTANSAVGDDKLAVVNMLFLPLCLSLVLSLVVIYGSYEKLS